MLILQSLSIFAPVDSITIDHWVLSKHHTFLRCMCLVDDELIEEANYNIHFKYDHNGKNCQLSYTNIIEQLIIIIKRKRSVNINKILQQHSLYDFLNHIEFLTPTQREYIILAST